MIIYSVPDVLLKDNSFLGKYSGQALRSYFSQGVEISP